MLSRGFSAPLIVRVTSFFRPPGASSGTVLIGRSLIQSQFCGETHAEKRVIWFAKFRTSAACAQIVKEQFLLYIDLGVVWYLGTTVTDPLCMFGQSVALHPLTMPFLSN